MEQWKVCIVCEVEKPPGAFYADHRMRDGRLNPSVAAKPRPH